MRESTVEIGGAIYTTLSGDAGDGSFALTTCGIEDDAATWLHEVVKEAAVDIEMIEAFKWAHFEYYCRYGKFPDDSMPL